MGIRFHCPNGHRLNVKSFLAGKRGICPHCSAKFIIPLKSPEKPDYRVPEFDESDRSKALGSDSSVNTLPVAPAVSQSQSEGDEETTVTETALESFDLAQSAEPSTSGDIPQAPGPTADIAPTGAAANTDAADAIAEAPHAIWYVRLPTGDQFGPAQASTMSRWLAEGRVSNESLVWREDWPQWKSASNVFPQLGNTAAPVNDSPPDPPAAPPVEPVAEAATSPMLVGAERRSRRRRANRGVWLLVSLIVVVLVLAPIVGYVLWTSS